MANDILLERLANLDSCAISDALDSLQLQGVVTRVKSVTVSKKIFGRAVTVKLVPKGSQQTNRHLGTAAVESASKGDIIVIEHCSTEVAGWGGNLGIAAHLREIGGVVIDGACRDADELTMIGFPVYARSVVPTTARGRIVEQSFNEVIAIDKVKVRPGDLVLADGSGVVFIPIEHAEAVIKVAEGIVENEAAMAKAILAGKPVSQVMGQKYETMLEIRAEK